MSEKTTLILQTQLFAEMPLLSLESPEGSDQFKKIVVDPTAMKVADWDQVLKAILGNDQCITL